VGINPVKALVYSAVLNGVAAVPLIFLIIRISVNKKNMRQYKSGLLSRIVLWLTFLGMAAAAIAMFVMLWKQ
jgi:Mn2+/Fe2+ NRAMP family transporter